ncbi:MAG: 3-oxoacyl-(acyl-carrier-protein) synthase 3 protein 1 [Firmicutes bacterium]|nr:3-oxoacyl-(acyl-carrier-protein) synthase 3 protein 1 [candidate division NPL-UPA2 bacterium]
MPRAVISGTGAYVPTRVLTNKELESVIDTTADWILSRTGISERRIALPDEATSDLSYPAAKQALENAGLLATDIDAIIVATITPDMLFPSTACIIQAKLGAKNAVAFDLSAACTGFVYGLQLAVQAIESGSWRHVLVVGAETLSRIVDWQDRNTCVLFGDGAGAAVVSAYGKGPRILGVHLGADGTDGHVLTLPAGGSRLPASLETVNGRRHFVHMNGQEVYKFAVRIVDEACSQLLDKLGLNYEDVDFYIPHQANLRIIEGFAKRLKVPLTKIAVNLDRYGNMSGASIPVALHEFSERQPRVGDKVMLVGFGGGLTWGSCLLEWQVD